MPFQGVPPRSPGHKVVSPILSYAGWVSGMQSRHTSMLIGILVPLSESSGSMGQMESRHSPRERKWVGTLAWQGSLEVELIRSWAMCCPWGARLLELGAPGTTLFLAHQTGHQCNWKPDPSPQTAWRVGRLAHWPGMVPWTLRKVAVQQSLLGAGWAQPGGSRTKAVCWIKVGMAIGLVRTLGCGLAVHQAVLLNTVVLA